MEECKECLNMTRTMDERSLNSLRRGLRRVREQSLSMPSNDFTLLRVAVVFEKRLNFDANITARGVSLGRSA